MLVQQLRLIQERCGYLPRPELEALSVRLKVPLYRLNEVISFFPHFRMEPPPDVEVHVCRDLACHLRGAPGCLRSLKEVAAEFGGEAQVKVEGVSCLGRCDGAPAVLIELHRAGRPDGRVSYSDRRSRTTRRGCGRSSRRTSTAARCRATRSIGRRGPGGSTRIITFAPTRPAQSRRRSRANKASFRRSGLVTGERFYQAVHSFADKLKQAHSTDSRRLGRRRPDRRGLEGGRPPRHGRGRNPAFRKWCDVREARGEEKYIVCNADESEPATFKDRELLLRTPDLVIEGMVLAALLVRAPERVHLHPARVSRPDRRPERGHRGGRASGVIGPDVLGTGLAVRARGLREPGRLRLRRAGGLDRGDRGAQGRAAQPPAPARDQRAVRQAHPAQQRRDLRLGAGDRHPHGGEWYAAAGRKAGAWYARKGKPGGKGLRFFSICGDVRRPGVFEVEIGSTLGELIDLAGGVRDGLPLKAVAPSGPRAASSRRS